MDQEHGIYTLNKEVIKETNRPIHTYIYVVCAQLVKFH